MMGRLKLTLHPEKTRVRRAEDGFDFLGIHLRLCRVRKWNAKRTQSCRLWPSEKAVTKIKARIQEVIGRRFGTPLREIVGDLNPVIRGWNRYRTTVSPERRRLLTLNRYVRERIRIFLKRKYNDRTRGSWRLRGNLCARLGVAQFG